MRAIVSHENYFEIASTATINTLMSNSSAFHAEGKENLPIRTIKSLSGFINLDIREIYDCRHLFFAFVKRDYQMRFRQTLIGMAWVLFQPLMYVLVFNLIMNKIGKVDTGDVPYSLYAFIGICAFQLYSRALNEGSNCFIADKNIITKVYFPRLILPLTTCVSGLLDFSIIFVIALVYAAFTGYTPTVTLMLAPVFVIATLMASLGMSLWLSTLNALYRDVRYIVGFLSQFMLFITPVFYSLKSVPEDYQWIYALNPLVLPIEGLRWSLLGTAPDGDLTVLVTSGIVNIVLFITGLYFFRQMEQRVVDFL